jgi:hypothetical protein
MLLISVIFSLPGFAQFTMTVDSVETASFPTLKIRVTTESGGFLLKNLDTTNFTVSEDGYKQSGLKYSCPGATENFSLAAAISVGSSMTEGEVNIGKGVLGSIVNRMNVGDELGFVKFSNILLAEDMNSNTAVLLDAIDKGINWQTTPDSRLWDGVYDAVVMCAQGGTNSSRAVLILSNGVNTGSNRTLNEVINLAKQGSIRVFALGINAQNSDADLKFICAQTGGIYYVNGDLAVQNIINDLSGTPRYCYLTYTTNNACRDGLSRSLEVKAKSGNDSVTVTKSFSITQDTGTNVAVQLMVDTASIKSGGQKTVGLLLKTSVSNQRLYGSQFRLRFDTAQLAILQVRTDSTLGKDNVATFQPLSNGAVITLTGASILNGKGKLFQIEFLSKKTVTQATTVPMAIDTVIWSRGCLNVQKIESWIKILPKLRSMSSTSQPLVFQWDDPSKSYSPKVGRIELKVKNNGDLPLTNCIATFPDVPEVQLVQGSVTAAPVVPGTLQPGDEGLAVWFVKPVPRADEKSMQSTVTVQSQEGASCQSQLIINIKPATMALALSCTADKITISGGKHTPNPATIRTTVKAAGTLGTPAGQVGIILPPELTLVGGTATQSFNALTSGASQDLDWKISYPTTLPGIGTFEVKVALSAAGLPDDTAMVSLVVPPNTGAQLQGLCALLSTVVTYDIATKSYLPFRVRGVVHNNGGGASDSVFATLTILPELAFVNDTATKLVSASIAGNDSATVGWNLTVPTVSCVDRVVNIQYRVYSAASGQIVSCTIPVTIAKRPNVKPALGSYSPANLDTLTNGTTQTFQVNATDADGDQLHYTWSLNGSTVGSDQNSYNATFSTDGQQILTCIISDFCNDTVVVIWKFIVKTKTGISRNPEAMKQLAILGNYPNPFNPGTVIEYAVPQGKHHIELDVIDARGDRIATLVNAELSAGIYQARFLTPVVSTQVLFARLRSESSIFIHPLLLLK